MKRIFIIMLLLLSICLFSCSHDNNQEPEEDKTPIIIEDDEDKKDDEKQEDKEEKETDEKEEEPKVKTVSEYDSDEEIIAYLSQYFPTVTSFKYETKGTTKAKVWFIESVQDIYSLTIKNNNEAYFKTTSSGFVTQTQDAYFNGDDVRVKNNGGSLEEISVSDYLSIYGLEPRDNTFLGYYIDKEHVTKIERLEKDGDNYQFKLTLDGNTQDSIRTQIKTFGDLVELPDFNEMTLTITITEKFTPVKIVLNSNYNINRGGILNNLNCVQELTITCLEFKTDIEVPTV